MEAYDLFKEFQQKYQLTDIQRAQFETYYHMLVKTNELFNITAITDLDAVIKYHFEDSLVFENYRDLRSTRGIVDIGSGAGFPGIPLKIKYPHIPVILVEVTNKKIAFLESVITQLGLTGIECCSLDWRTFLRKTHYAVDFICARASLHPEELIRMFKPSSPYQGANLVYWASSSFIPDQRIMPYIQQTLAYTIGKKERMLVIMGIEIIKDR